MNESWVLLTLVVGEFGQLYVVSHPRAGVINIHKKTQRIIIMRNFLGKNCANPELPSSFIIYGLDEGGRKGDLCVEPDYSVSRSKRW